MMDRDICRALADRFVMILFQIGRQSGRAGFGVLARESLPGKVVFAQREVTGEFFESLAQDTRHGRTITGCKQFIILCRGYAKSEKRCLAAGDPTDRRSIEQRGKFLLEKATLLARIARLHQV